jgi:hypothetical protein
MGRLPVMSGRGVGLIVLTVFVPIIEFISVVILTAKSLSPKNALAAGAKIPSNGKTTASCEAGSRTDQQDFRMMFAVAHDSTATSPDSNSGACQDGRRRYASTPEDR